MTDNKIEVFNLATGDKIGEVKSYSADEAKEKIDRARIAQKRWAGEIFSESTGGRVENFSRTGVGTKRTNAVKKLFGFGRRQV